MITLAFLLANLAPQDPSPKPGAGFADAARIYDKVANGHLVEDGTMKTRLATVQKRVEEITTLIGQSDANLVSLERQEMEATLRVQTMYQGEELDRRLEDIRRNVEPRRILIVENRAMLEQDLARAKRDLDDLLLQSSMAVAAKPAAADASKAARTADERVKEYFRAKARELGIPPYQSLPEPYGKRQAMVR